MTISNFRSVEPMFLIILRQDGAERLLKDWAKSHRLQVSIEGNRMRLFEQRSLDLFHMHWNHGWQNVTVWDYWNKRHIWFT